MSEDTCVWECPTCATMNPENGTRAPCQRCGEEYFDPSVELAGDVLHGDTIGIGVNDLEAYVVGQAPVGDTGHVMLVLTLPADTKFRFVSREVDGCDGVGRRK